MPAGLSEEEVYKIARKRVEEKKGFYSHLTAYVIVNILIFIIWWFTSSSFPWFLFPLVGWGIGIVFHFLDAMKFHNQSAWEQREVEKEVERIRQRKYGPDQNDE